MVENLVSQSRDILSKAILEYGAENIALSFNGGKDCTVLLHLYTEILRRNPELKDMKIDCLYVEDKDPFIEVDEFISYSREFFNLRIYSYSTGIKAALQEFLASSPKRAIILGNRRTDPYSDNLRDFNKTDPGWPEIMRVHPILSWSYTDVWTYLRNFGVPYCCLYDQGYTSLGSRGNTVATPALKCKDYACGYMPAWRLKDDSLERQGRSS